ncbi:MAG: phosphate ABC transporter ATP-binding protein [Verrucomicrobiales bacterium]|nr:phosphate ABC transporter ATP-binding protein [Verrucomicrobiales bacterium]
MKFETYSSSRESCCDREACAPVLSASDLSLFYGRKAAFRGVNLDIHEGCITALVGPSGCGKSSFLQSLNRLTDLIPACRIEGTVTCCGKDIHEPATDLIALRRRVGLIFQKPSPLPFSIRRNLDFPLREHGFTDRGEREAKMESALRDVCLWDEVKERLDSPATSLSGGQQQRLCIARALALEPQVLLLDEPCSALDPISSGAVEDLIADLRNRFTVVVVTHNLAQARRIADDVAFFWVKENAGRLIEHGPAEAIFSDPENELTRAYIAGLRG